jgi:hypothetical protein
MRISPWPVLHWIHRSRQVILDSSELSARHPFLSQDLIKNMTAQSTMNER